MRNNDDLLRSYENGPRIWDATAVLPDVYALADKGLIEPTGSNNGAYRLTEAGRTELASLTCDANARKGTGTGICGRALDSLGQCDRASDHLD